MMCVRHHPAVLGGCPPARCAAPVRRGSHGGSRGGSRGAFTLIEVLMAAVIIALGALGLLALFAGAASQQQESSRSTLASFVSANAQRTLEESLGKLVPDVRGATVTVPLDGRWKHFDQDNTPGRRTLVAPPQFAALRAPRVNLPHLLFARVDDGTDATTPGLAWEGRFVEGGGSAAFTASGAVRHFSHANIDPDSLTMRVEISYLVPAGGAYVRDGRTSLELRREPMLNSGDTNYASDRPGEGRFIYTLNGLRTRDPNYVPNGFETDSGPFCYAIVDVSQSNDPTNPAPARVVEFEIYDPNLLSARIERIVATQFNWRTKQLLSVSDRLVRRSDDTAPTGTRPDLAFSVLYRLSPGDAKAAMFVYQLTATSSSGDYEPRESLADFTNDRAPLRRVRNVVLREDAALKQTRIEVTGEANAFITTPGQVLVIESEGVNPGSDGIYRVQRQVRVGNVFQGYLDRSPRRGGRAILSADDRQNGTARSVDVIGVAETHTADDGSVWRLRPVEGRIIQIPLAQ